jgi:hypothetical protein
LVVQDDVWEVDEVVDLDVDTEDETEEDDVCDADVTVAVVEVVLDDRDVVVEEATVLELELDVVLV